MEQTVCSETLAYKIQMLGNYPEESLHYSEHGKCLKSRVSRKYLYSKLQYIGPLLFIPWIYYCWM